MADVITTTDIQTLGLLNLAQLIIDGFGADDWAAASNDMAFNNGFVLPDGVSFASMTDAGPPPETPTFGSDSAAFQAWLASLS